MAKDDPVAAGYRYVAGECLREAKNARFPEVRKSYEKLASQWLQLAEETERAYGGGPPE